MYLDDDDLAIYVPFNIILSYPDDERMIMKGSMRLTLKLPITIVICLWF